MTKEPLRLDVNTPPSYYNDEMWIGAGIGTLVTPLLGTAIGAGIGGYIGNGRMETEAKHGKEVKEPSMVNREMASGAAIGYMAAGFVMLGIVAVGAAAGIGIEGSAGGSIGLASLVLGSLAGLASMPIGAYIGGSKGKERMAEEKQQAIEQQHAMAPSHQRSHQTSHAHEPEHAVENKKHFTKMIDGQRAAASSYDVSP